MLNFTKNLNKILSLSLVFLFFVSSISYADVLRPPMNGARRAAKLLPQAQDSQLAIGQTVGQGIISAADYGSSGTFTEVSRNGLFGLRAIPAKKRSLSQLLRLRRTEKILDAPDLNAGLINRPGARYYLWTGTELKYFVAKDVKREDIAKTGDPDLEQNRYNQEVEAIREFLNATNVKFPFYIFAHIPDVLREGAELFDIKGRKTHATRLGNMPVLTLGYLVSKPYGVTLAKMRHELIAFRVKQEGGSRLDQHIAGLITEYNWLENCSLEVNGQISEMRENRKADKIEGLKLVRLNIVKEMIKKAIEETKALLKESARQSHGVRSYFYMWNNLANDYSDMGATGQNLASEETIADRIESSKPIRINTVEAFWEGNLRRGAGNELTTVSFTNDKGVNLSTYITYPPEMSLEDAADSIRGYFSRHSVDEGKDLLKTLRRILGLSIFAKPIMAASTAL